ncbi:Diacylglycerol kinase [Modestobacter italicus]|uniref:Diacylglycerol kinase n=1 Tax=Modestobacter italicus (strain DSM 44449 / CECT 9708 / BC 501) TaxID=2732864 RepID=I4EXX5_MODI5|nr:diacylglycerol kinase family protein [Modestobacter marinus]CCH88238.1 Diacylglycerol kinase [Modestobacter marinus]
MESSPARRWWARAALVLVVLSGAVLLVFAERRGLWLLLLTAAAAVVVVAAAFWFLQQRGVLRWVALAVVVGVPLAVLVLFVAQRLLWVALLALALWAVAVLAGRAALRPDHAAWSLPVVDAPDALRPFVVMNPRSGGGKVTRFGLQQRAEHLGAEVALIDRPGTDVQQLARDALARGADLLGVAGGDGTQALVAQVAAEHDVPFLVISAGTRNHFALDLGLDREDPTGCLAALRDGVEARIDLGEINGRPFVNNASFGAYAEIVDDPAYREEKRGTALDALPDLLSGRRGAHLTGDVDGLVVDGAQALLVSNNPYEATDLAGMGRRARLDRGVLGVVAVRVGSVRQAPFSAARGPPPRRADGPGPRGRRPRGHPDRAGRRRRGVRAPVRPGALHRPPRRPAGPAAPGAARRPAARCAAGLGLALGAGARAPADLPPRRRRGRRPPAGAAGGRGAPPSASQPGAGRGGRRSPARRTGRPDTARPPPLSGAATPGAAQLPVVVSCRPPGSPEVRRCPGLPPSGPPG